MRSAQLRDFSALRLFPLSLLRLGAEFSLCLLPLGERERERDLEDPDRERYVRLPRDFRERLALAVDVRASEVSASSPVP